MNTLALNHIVLQTANYPVPVLEMLREIADSFQACLGCVLDGFHLGHQVLTGIIDVLKHLENVLDLAAISDNADGGLVDVIHCCSAFY